MRCSMFVLFNALNACFRNVRYYDDGTCLLLSVLDLVVVVVVVAVECVGLGCACC